MGHDDPPPMSQLPTMLSGLADPIPPALAANAEYEVVREINRGGMGVVYLVRNRRMDRLEALKVIQESILKQAGTLERFEREMRSAARLNHPNIVTAFSSPPLPGLLAFAMEYIEGTDLDSLVQSHGPLPVSNACFYSYEVAQGLQHAHEGGLVHRDIKPNNLVLKCSGDRQIVKILDFGLAKATSENQPDSGLTGTGQMMGTPHYVAPEQIKSAARADIRADIYSLGCTLYYLLTGARPFDGKGSLYEILTAHHVETARPVNEVRPDVPDSELAAIVARMMAKDPAQRYQKPADVAVELAPYFKAGIIPIPADKSSFPPAAAVTPTIDELSMDTQAKGSSISTKTPSTTESAAAREPDLGATAISAEIEGQRAGDQRVDNGLTMKLVWCPPGKFTMGSPKSEKERFGNEDQVEVTLTTGFWLGRCVVTQDQWRQVMGTSPWKKDRKLLDYVKEGIDYPATYVSWQDAVEFADELTRQERTAGRLPAGQKFTLPTEAQWEYACRAGSNSRFSFGNDESGLAACAWFDKNALDAGEKYAHVVATKKPNAWRLHDMHGNVWEWCQDNYGEKLPGGTDPFVASGGLDRVFRGGGWLGSARCCRSAYRGKGSPASRNGFLGFRVALGPSSG